MILPPPGGSHREGLYPLIHLPSHALEDPTPTPPNGPDADQPSPDEDFGCGRRPRWDDYCAPSGFLVTENATLCQGDMSRKKPWD